MDNSKQTAVFKTSVTPYFDDPSKKFIASQSVTHMDKQQHQKWNSPPTSFSCVSRNEQPFTGFESPSSSPSSAPFNPKHDIDGLEQLTTNQPGGCGKNLDLISLLNSLSFLEQKIRQLQDIIHTISNREGLIVNPADELIAHQQLVTADLTSILIQLISTAGALLSSQNNLLSGNSSFIDQLGNLLGTTSRLVDSTAFQKDESLAIEKGDCLDSVDQNKACGTEQNYAGELDTSAFSEDNEIRDHDDAAEGENLPPGSYEILQLEKDEILAPHTHFCSICGKGFKRDANLRMHMRGHGDEYKTVAALSKPYKDSNSKPVLVRRYSCPSVGCKRNKDHKKFQPLKTILCVKNHYKRSHCDKSYTCSRCNSKKFSVIADLKTHEKHCGQDKWLCSCGTTFSRKDKLFGHAALFQGHSPVLLPMDEIKSSGASQQGQATEATTGSSGSKELDFGSRSSSEVHILDLKSLEEPGCISVSNCNTYNFGGSHKLSQQEGYEALENPYYFIHSGSCNFTTGTSNNSSSNIL